MKFFTTNGKIWISALIILLLLIVAIFVRCIDSGTKSLIHTIAPHTLATLEHLQHYQNNSPHIRILPINRAKFLAGQRFDFLVEFSDELAQSSQNLQVSINDTPAQNFFAKEAKTTQNNGILSYRIDNVAFHKEGVYIVSASDGKHSAQVAYQVVVEKQGFFSTKAKNVIVLIGDGMSLQAKQMARILSKGINEGKYNGILEMEQMPQMALVTTSGYDSLTTDSANSASAYATGHKSVVNAMGVYEASIDSHLGHPKVENIAEILRRTSDKSIGLVTTSNLTDATPAAFITHTRQRYKFNDIALDMFDSSHRADVLLGGGLENYLPQEDAQSKRKDSHNIIEMYQNAGYEISYDKAQLQAQASAFSDVKPFSKNRANSPKLLGLYHKNHLNVYLDREVLQNSEVLGKFTNQPNLMDMTKVALNALSQNKAGFFLMIEGASIDKELHKMDWQRAAYDTIEFDKAVGIAREFARENGETLIIVVADHAHGASITGTYYESDGKVGREAVRTYKHAKFPTFEDKDNDGFPDNPNAEITLAVHFANHPDYYANYRLREKPAMPTIKQESPSQEVSVKEGEPAGGKSSEKVFVANPNLSGEHYDGNIPRNEDQEVHSADDVILTAEGVGSEYFRGVMDNTEVFFGIARALGLDARE